MKTKLNIISKHDLPTGPLPPLKNERSSEESHRNIDCLFLTIRAIAILERVTEMLIVFGNFKVIQSSGDSHRDLIIFDGKF